MGVVGSDLTAYTETFPLFTPCLSRVKWHILAAKENLGEEHFSWSRYGISLLSDDSTSRSCRSKFIQQPDKYTIPEETSNQYLTTCLQIFVTFLSAYNWCKLKFINHPHYKKTHTLWKHPASYLYSHIPQSLPRHQLLPWHWWSHHWFQEPDMPHPEKCFLTWWPWPLTYDPDLRTWPRYSSTRPTCRNSGLYVCPFSRERGNTHTHTHTHTDRHTMSKLLHPSLTRGVKMLQSFSLIWSRVTPFKKCLKLYSFVLSRGSGMVSPNVAYFFRSSSSFDQLTSLPNKVFTQKNSQFFLNLYWWCPYPREQLGKRRAWYRKNSDFRDTLGSGIQVTPSRNVANCLTYLDQVSVLHTQVFYCLVKGVRG